MVYLCMGKTAIVAGNGFDMERKVVWEESRVEKE